jgi:glycosyltransferase involved in cell wall biosynthesis
VLDLAKALSDRFEPVILAPMARGCRRSDKLEGIRVERFRYAPSGWQTLAAPGAIMPNLRANPWLLGLVPLFVVAQIGAIVSLLRRERFDAVHCHWLVPQGLALAIARLFVRVPPTLLTCHGADAFTLNFAPMPLVKRWILGRADGVTVVSREIAAHIPAAPERPTVHIPMGVDVQRFAGTRRKSKSGKPTILFIGRLAEKKGLDRLLRCMTDPRLVSSGASLRVIGEGPLRGPLQALARQLGIDERVEFVGAVPHEQLADEMARASLFCAPFVIGRDGDREGTPTVLLEAAAARIPIVTTDVGGCRDVVRGGESGWLVEPDDEAALADAIVQALGNPRKAGAMAERAHRTAEQHSWHRIGGRYAEALSEARATAGGARR